MATARSTEDIDRQRGSLGAAAIGTVGSGSASTLPSHVNAAPAVVAVFETLKVRKESAVLFADIAAPPMNLLGPALVRDLVSLIQQAEVDKFPAGSLAAVKDRVNAIALAPADDFRRDSDLFGEGARKPEAQSRFQAAFKRGFQTRDAEMDLARLVGDLD